MAQLNQLYDQLINQANQLDESIDTMIWMLNALFWAMIVSLIFSMSCLSLSMKSAVIFAMILAVIGKLIWNQVLQHYDQAQQLYHQANNLRGLPRLDGDLNR